MTTLTFTDGNGTRQVLCTHQLGGAYRSRLYVNGGETATTVTARHHTEAAATRWAQKTLKAAKPEKPLLPNPKG